MPQCGIFRSNEMLRASPLKTHQRPCLWTPPAFSKKAGQKLLLFSFKPFEQFSKLLIYSSKIQILTKL